MHMGLHGEVGVAGVGGLRPFLRTWGSLGVDCMASERAEQARARWLRAGRRRLAAADRFAAEAALSMPLEVRPSPLMQHLLDRSTARYSRQRDAMHARKLQEVPMQPTQVQSMTRLRLGASELSVTRIRHRAVSLVQTMHAEPISRSLSS
jgi:hypothetical protein